MILSFDSCTTEENYLNDLITHDFLVHFFLLHYIHYYMKRLHTGREILTPMYRC